jgi:protein-S-isoprenylcysteine O-methyltransferase Ste14
MSTAVLVIGLAVAAMLLCLLLLTLLGSTFRIWPTPEPGSWQSYVFWPLFRSLNVLCFLVAALDKAGYLGLPNWLRTVAFAALVTSTALFIYAFRMLGRDNSYGARDGLVTGGIYRWSRNPQNAMLIVVYGCLAVAADGGATYLLCAAMMAVYALMVLCEEPWLESVYGGPYRRYCRRVPRFFNWRRALFTAWFAAKQRGSKST